MDGTLFQLSDLISSSTPADEEFFSMANVLHPFPATRYQGAKTKLIDWIHENTKHLSFHSVLDAFGGTGVVSHCFKRMRKEVWYNDFLRFNYLIGKALIENTTIKLNKSMVKTVLSPNSSRCYPSFIQDTFKDIFYLPEENVWLDMVITNIHTMSDEYEQALAWFSLFQAAIAKRPYNLFHRANLSVRTAEVKRSFGNKVTWDTPFDVHFRKYVDAANKAVFDSGIPCYAMNREVMKIPNHLHFDLVYMDPPYLSEKNIGTDYLDFYHFLEGMVDYDHWGPRLLRQYKHYPLEGKGMSPWTKKDTIVDAFANLFEKFRDSILVVSYRNDGIPSPEVIRSLLAGLKSKVTVVQPKTYHYVLSKKETSELLFIAE